VYVDESGIAASETYDYGWCKKGERFYALKSGKSRQRLSIVGALNEKQFMAPLLLNGYCNTQVIDYYVEHCLVPELKPGQVVIWDNASIHKSAQAQRLIERAGCELKFLPPYSPDFNPIEHYWFKIKNTIRKQLSQRQDLDFTTGKVLRHMC
jgi:transposase